MSNEIVEEVDFFEFYRKSERRSSRKQLLISNRKRVSILLEEGYGLEEVLQVSMDCEMIKQSRADSLRGFGWNNPMDILSGAAETTGSALKAMDVLGVGNAAGIVVGAGAALVGAGADVTVQTGRLLVDGVTTSTKVVADGFTNVGGGVIGAGKTVGVGVLDAGKSMFTSVRKLSPKRGPTARLQPANS
ncbi:MAG: hypothetical protein SGILL_000149 [Bacillariaceae sp.]